MAGSSAEGNSPAFTRGSVNPRPEASNRSTPPSGRPATPNPAPFAVRTEGAGATTLNRAGRLFSVPRRTTICAGPMGVSSGTCTVSRPGVAERIGASRLLIRTSRGGSPIDVGNGAVVAMKPATGPRLMPAICSNPPGETLLGAGCSVTAFTAPR